MRRARLKHFRNQPPSEWKPSPQNSKPESLTPHESRQVRFQRIFQYELRKIREQVCQRRGDHHYAYLDGATRSRVRTLARKMARQAAQYS